VTIYLTPYDPADERKRCTGPSEDIGVPDFESAIDLFGTDWIERLPRCITYADFAVSDFVLSRQP